MHAGKRYTLKEFLYWTRRDIYVLITWSGTATLVYQLAGWHWIGLPWVPIALIGTAAAFLVGFRNTQTYNRLWEARQIWGAIVNSSRSWTMLVLNMVKPAAHDENATGIRRELVYRHLAWLNVLRFQLREPRAWENIKGKPSNEEFSQRYTIEEWATKPDDIIPPYLPKGEWEQIAHCKNRATQILNRQSSSLRQLREEGCISPLDYVELQRLLTELYEHQGRCERIKNFPYPRQFATINQMFVRLFSALVPFGILNEFHKLGDWQVWFTVPFSVTVAWVFMAIEKVGESTENPFEGSANDVPITAMSRTIEIDLREMLGETNLPAAKQPQNEILM